MADVRRLAECGHDLRHFLLRALIVVAIGRLVALTFECQVEHDVCDQSADTVPAAYVSGSQFPAQEARLFRNELCPRGKRKGPHASDLKKVTLDVCVGVAGSARSV